MNTNRQKAAATLLALDPETTKGIFKELDSEEVCILSREIADLDTIDPDRKTDLMNDFSRLLRQEKDSLMGGQREAFGLLNKFEDLPSAKAALLNLKTEYGDRPFGELRILPTRILRSLLAHEHPQVIALVLVHLAPEQAREILVGFDEKMEADIAFRISRMDSQPPKRQAVSEVEQRLRESAEAIMASEMPPAGGTSPLIEMLKKLGARRSAPILKGLEKISPEMAQLIRKGMFAFEDLVLLDDRGMQTVLKSIETRDLAIALMSAPPAVEQIVFRNLSERGGEVLKEEIEDMGSMRKRDIEMAREKILAVVGKLEKDGQITIDRE